MIRPHSTLLALLTMLLSFPATSAQAQLVPGSGVLFNTDDFEAEDWSWSYNLPKSSKEEDEQIRYPLAVSANGKWKEGPKRGTPDVVKTVEAPPGGLPGSKRALLLRTKDSGIPGRVSYQMKQDDFVMVSRSMSISYAPQVVTRVYLPDWDEWEDRHGVTFGFRIGMQGPYEKVPDEDENFRLFRRGKKVKVIEPFYPGFFIQFNPKEHPNFTHDHAVILIRADEYGREIPGPAIRETGWWTFGMSVTPDTRVHFYAKPGVEDLTAADLICSSQPYGIPAQQFNTLFFNVCNQDDGRTWSTPWIIDDPQIFYGTSKAAPATQTTQQQSRGGLFRR